MQGLSVPISYQFQTNPISCKRSSSLQLRVCFGSVLEIFDQIATLSDFTIHEVGNKFFRGSMTLKIRIANSCKFNNCG